MKKIHIFSVSSFAFISLMCAMHFVNSRGCDAKNQKTVEHVSGTSAPSTEGNYPPSSPVEVVGAAQQRFPSGTRKSYSLIDLERIGRVPVDANELSWRLAEKTSWWGRRIDPASFWSNHVVWLDSEAESEAHAHGRGYPPIPPGENLFLDRSDKDTSRPVVTWESRGRAYWSSGRENAYWDWFRKTKPHPPDSMEQALARAGEDWQSVKRRSREMPTGLKIPPPSVESDRKNLENRYVSLGYPKEAFSATVLDWEYVRAKREEKRRILLESGESEADARWDDFHGRLACPASPVDDPPSDEELRVTRGWRVAYLRRLRREGTDESYVEAYKKAWNLSEDDLREGEQGSEMENATWP